MDHERGVIPAGLENGVFLSATNIAWHKVTVLNEVELNIGVNIFDPEPTHVEVYWREEMFDPSKADMEFEEWSLLGISDSRVPGYQTLTLTNFTAFSIPSKGICSFYIYSSGFIITPEKGVTPEGSVCKSLQLGNFYATETKFGMDSQVVKKEVFDGAIRVGSSVPPVAQLGPVPSIVQINETVTLLASGGPDGGNTFYYTFKVGMQQLCKKRTSLRAICTFGVADIAKGLTELPVVLTVCDVCRYQCSIIKSFIEVVNELPTVSSTSTPLTIKALTSPNVANTPTSIVLQFTIQDVHRIHMDWGDYTTTTFYSPRNGICEHTYTSGGLYNVSVVLKGGFGDVLSQASTIVLVNTPATLTARGGVIDTTPGVRAGSMARFAASVCVEGGLPGSHPYGHVGFVFGRSNFLSTKFTVFIISAGCAKVEGTGKINNKGDISFVAVACSYGNEDLFGIKIWDVANPSKIIFNNFLAEDGEIFYPGAIEHGSVEIYLFTERIAGEEL